MYLGKIYHRNKIMTEKFKYEAKPEYCPEPCENIKGNVLDLDVKRTDSEIRADIQVSNEKKCCVRIWGQITDCYGKPIEHALVKLLETCRSYGKIEYKGVAHTTTDCKGYYQFEVCLDDEYDKFRIIVSKTNTGSERVICNDGICEPCKEECK